MKNKKFTPIAMKCNESQFKEVESILIDNGLEIADIRGWHETAFLINDFRKNKITNVDIFDSTFANPRWIMYYEWDKDIFLKACGIEIEKKEINPLEQTPLKKFVNLSSKETAKKETEFTHMNMGGDWFEINSNQYKEQIKKIFYHGELKDNRGSLFVAELNDGKLVIFRGIKGDEFNDI